MLSNSSLLTSRDNIQAQQLTNKLINLVSPLKPIRLLILNRIKETVIELTRNGHNVINISDILLFIKDKIGYDNTKEKSVELLDSFLRTIVPASKKEDLVMLILEKDYDDTMKCICAKLGIEVINICYLTKSFNRKVELSNNHSKILISCADSTRINGFQIDNEFNQLVPSYYNTSGDRKSIEEMVLTNSTCEYESKVLCSSEQYIVMPFYCLIPDVIIYGALESNDRLYPGQNSYSKILTKIFHGFSRMMSIYFNIQSFNSWDDYSLAFKQGLILHINHSPVTEEVVSKYLIDCVGGDFLASYQFPMSGILSSDAAFGKLMRIALTRIIRCDFSIADKSCIVHDSVLRCIGSEDESLSQMPMEIGQYEHTNISITKPHKLTDLQNIIPKNKILFQNSLFSQSIHFADNSSPLSSMIYKLLKSSGKERDIIEFPLNGKNDLTTSKNLWFYDFKQQIDADWMYIYPILKRLKHFKLFCIRNVHDFILPVGEMFALPYYDESHYLHYIDENNINIMVDDKVEVDKLCLGWYNVFQDEDISRYQAMKIVSLNTIITNSVEYKYPSIATFSISNTSNKRELPFDYLMNNARRICCLPNLRCNKLLLNRDIEFTVNQDGFTQLVDHHKGEIVSDWCYDPSEFMVKKSEGRTFYVYDLRDILSKLSWVNFGVETFGGLNGNDSLFSLWMVVSNYELLDSSIQTIYNTQTCYVKIIPEMLRVIYGNDSNSLYELRKLITHQSLGEDAIDTGESEIAAYYNNQFLNVSGHLADMLMYSSYHIFDFQRYFMSIEYNLLHIGNRAKDNLVIKGLTPERDFGVLWHNLIEYHLAIDYARYVCKKYGLLLYEEDISTCNKCLNRLRYFKGFNDQSFSGLRVSKVSERFM